MDFSHVPVLYSDVIELLNIKPNGIYIDGTMGGAGHSAGIAQKLSPNGRLIGIDKDADALAAGGERLRQLQKTHPFALDIVHGNFSEIKMILADLGIEKIDGALLDLGVSSFQLDNPQRGFSYMNDAPLDMRMDADDALSAFDVVNGYTKDELTAIIRDYGEERWAARIAEFIVKKRQTADIKTTFELVDVIKAAMPAAARREGPHPAKRTFQAIRIEVNDELGHLEAALSDFTDALAIGGRFAVISFHSLEDRIVKEYFAKRLDPCTCPADFPVCTCGKKPDIAKVTRKPVAASDEELKNNPRSRSAKLRVIEKIEKQ